MKKPRQSKDFNEITNLQTDVNITQEAWDKAFHNYENPDLCAQRKRIEGCLVCERLIKQKEGLENV